MNEELTQIVDGLIWVATGVILLVIVRYIYRLLTPYNLERELTDNDNPAAGLVLVGFLLGTTAIFLGAVWAPGEPEALVWSDLWRQIGVTAGYTVGGAFALRIGMEVVDKLVLPRFSVQKEIVEDRNVGTAAVVAGCCVATGLIIAGAIQGEGGGWWTALAFFGLGQAALVLLAVVYQWITSYDLHAEIERDNVAAGTAFGLTVVAFGLILMRAVAGDMLSWKDNLLDFAYYTVMGFVLLIVLQKVVDHVLLPGASLPKEIAQDCNMNAAWIEGGFAISVAAMVMVVL